MRPMPMRALSFLLYAYVGWRIAPDLGALWMSMAFGAVLVASVLTLPFAFRARQAQSPTTKDRVLAWSALLGMGLFSSLFVLTLLSDLGLGAVAIFNALVPGSVPMAGFTLLTARAVPLLA